MKKIISIILIFFMSLGEVNAFFDQTHIEIARNTFEQANFKNENLIKLYASAALLADIGWCSWDKKYSISDKEEFCDELKNIAEKKSFESEIFALGWKNHVTADNNGAARLSIFNSKDYNNARGKFEQYLRYYKNSKITTLGEDSFYINTDLIRETYKKLNDFEPTDAEIFSEINKLFIFIRIAWKLIENFAPLSNEERLGIKNEIERVAKLCVGDVKGLKDTSEFKKIFKKFIKIEIDESKLLSIEKEIYKIGYFVKIGKFCDFDEIKYVVEDEEKFENLIKEVAKQKNINFK